MNIANKPGRIIEAAVVAEMTTDGVGTIDVPVDADLVGRLVDGDKDPMFVTLEVISDGVSGNGRDYDPSVVASLVEQINAKKPEGYWGHLADNERATKFPEPQTIWIGAMVTEVEGKTRLFAKGYVLPEAKALRSYLKKAKAAGKNVAVSVYGKYKYIVDKARDTHKVISMSLESIDWARPGSEGVKTMGMFSIASEMLDDTEEGINPDEGEIMKREEVLQSATADELREHSAVVSEMIDEAVAGKEAELTGVVSEMEAVNEALGIDKDTEKPASAVVKEMLEHMNELELDSQLRTKIESPSARTVIKELVLSEMKAGTQVAEAVDKVLGSETGQAIVKEMLEAAPRVAPRVVQPAATARKWTKKG